MLKELREELVDTLNKWRAGTLTAQGVHEHAESLWEERDEWPVLSRDSIDSIIVEVLHILSIMNYSLICEEDIDLLSRFLATPRGGEREAWRQWDKYWQNFDKKERARKLRENDFYIDFV